MRNRDKIFVQMQIKKLKQQNIVRRFGEMELWLESLKYYYYLGDRLNS